MIVRLFYFHTMNLKSAYKIGYISKVHGLKGEITAVLSESIDFDTVQTLFLEINNSLVPFFIESLSDRVDKTFIKFEDVNTPEEANHLKGASIYISKTERPKLKRGDFYDDEIIGFQVEDENLGAIGVIVDVIQSGPSKLYKVLNEEKEVLIPKTGPFIKRVNKSAKKMTVELPEGFLDI